MKITEVQTILLTAPGKHIGMPNTQRSAALIQIHTDVGTSGLGESYAGLYIAQAVPAIVDIFRPLLIGENPFAINTLWEKMRLRALRWGLVGLPLQVMSGIEMALWDLKGKALEVPAYELLGGLAQDRLRLYASAYASVLPISKTVEKVQYYADQGFTGVKLATGFWGKKRSPQTPIAEVVADECDKVEAIRKAVGMNVDLALDHHAANNAAAWTADTAIQVISKLDKFDLLWFEQPCLPNDVDAYAKLCAAVNTPIAGAEEATTLQELLHYLQKEALDIIQADCAWMGVMPTHQSFALARAYGVRATLHIAGTAVTRAANFHIALANANCFIAEYQVERNPLFDELLVEPFDIRDGYLHPPTAPGFGVHLPADVPDKYPHKPRTWQLSHQAGQASQSQVDKEQ